MKFVLADGRPTGRAPGVAGVLVGSALTVAATLASWLALVALGGLRAAGLEVLPAVEGACVVVAGPVAIAAVWRTVVSTWRGPPVTTFERRDAVALGPADAESIRSAAQLRGTMGGAGHVYPARLAFPIAAWVGALAAGAEALFARPLEPASPWPSAVAASAALVALLLPSRPYWYREVTGGGVLVAPAASALAVARSREQSGARAAEPGPGT